MKFSLAFNMHRNSPKDDMGEVLQHALDLVQIADEGGLDIVWAGEHHAIEYTIAPAPFQLLAWFAAHTKRIRLGTAVVVAPYWHPIRLAGEAAMLDNLRNGRLEFGIGRGAYQREFDRMLGGVPQQVGVAYMKEMLPVLLKLWQGDYAHSGEYWSFPSSTSVPKPLQKPHPPIWAAVRDPGSFDWAVANGCNVMTWAMYKGFGEVESLYERYRSAVAKSGRTTRPTFATGQLTAVYESKADWEKPVTAIIENSAVFEALYKGLRDIENGFTEPVELSTLTNREEFEPRRLHDSLVFGTPEEVTATLRRYEALGVEHFIFMVAGPSWEYKKRSLRLFANEVMPHFRERLASNAA